VRTSFASSSKKLLSLADRLGARPYDHQLGRFVDRGDIDEVVAGFA
jgi:hypothetical protein